MKTPALALVSILCSVAAQFSLKAGMSSDGVRHSLALPFGWRAAFAVLGSGEVLGGFLLYGLGAVVWLAVLAKWDVSKAYPLVGLGFALTAAVGFLAGEHVAAPRVIGIGLICLGVAVVGWS